MNLKNIISIAAALGLATAALAAEEIRTNMSIVIVESDGDDGFRIELDSSDSDLGIDFHAMQVGENRSIVDKSGRSILVTREADGIRFDVDGRSIKMPILHGDEHNIMWIDSDGAENVDIDFMHHRSKFLMNFGNFESMHGSDGTMIVTDKPVDEGTQQAIRSLLESAGHDSEVRFIDGMDHGRGLHEVRIMQREID